MTSIAETLNWIVDKWYYWLIILLAIALVLAIANILKNKNKRERHSEVKEHHEKIEKELAVNKLPRIKWLYQRNKKIGRIKGIAEKVINTPITRKVKSEQGLMLEEVEITHDKYWVIEVAVKSFLGIWTSKEHIVLPDKVVTFNYGRKRIELANNVYLEYYLGYLLPTEQKSKIFTFSDFYRTMMDKTVDGMGNQMINFSEIRDTWSHEMDLKEKEIEKLKEEKKLAGTKAR